VGNEVFDVFVSYARTDWRHAADSNSNRSITVSAFAASDGIFSFAIACLSGSAVFIPCAPRAPAVAQCLPRRGAPRSPSTLWRVRLRALMRGLPGAILLSYNQDAGAILPHRHHTKV
jgi:hypothetical protein